MDNQHRQIKGYRELSQPEIDLMNKIKEKGAEVGDLIQEINETIGEALSKDIESPLAREASRWTSIGKTHLQQGFMALTRAVAKPSFF